MGQERGVRHVDGWGVTISSVAIVRDNVGPGAALASGHQLIPGDNKANTNVKLGQNTDF